MGTLPLIVIVLFGLLVYYNVRNLSYRTVPLVRRELDKQLTQMVLIQVIHNVFVLTPFVIVTLIVVNYQSNELTNFFPILAIDIHNFYFASPFYIYMCVSKRFRQQFIHVFCNIHFNRLRQQILNNNRVLPQSTNSSINTMQK
ncbi:unnamed protein product [Rotaria socialis]|uniref:Uncharacterized protein n=1 Tax=Rotaria socialis TaxID=392032 RepID=A0A817WR84_9BILA|nr:unnamed protein product [Rotaria socialis]CAF4466286.1 unnamed protein product [Rotaria socialis]